MSLLGNIAKAVLNTKALITTAVANVRHASIGSQGRGRCLQWKPRCGKAQIPKLKCVARKLPAWIDPQCCLNPCKDAHPRFDELYYKPRDLIKRKFVRTWAECPKIYIRPRQICCYEKFDVPLPKRRRQKKSGIVCGTKMECLLMMMCRNKVNSKCAKIHWPGCKRVRNPPKCTQTRRPSKCRKVCTPFPAFSECQRNPPRHLRPVECRCLRIGTVCKR